MPIRVKLTLYIRIKTRKVVANMKAIKRKYEPKGTRRRYATIRIDLESRDKLKVLADKMEVPIIEAMKIAVDQLEKDQAKEPG